MTADYFCGGWSAIRSHSNHHLDRSLRYAQSGPVPDIAVQPGSELCVQQQLLANGRGRGKSRLSTQGPVRPSKQSIAFRKVISGGRGVIVTKVTGGQTEVR